MADAGSTMASEALAPGVPADGAGLSPGRIGPALARRLTLTDAHAEDDRSANESRGMPPAGRRVLVVDDNVDAAESLALLPELLRHRASTVHCGQHALDELGRQAYDAVLLDIGLPDRDGYGVARCARAMLGTATPLLIALTGWGQEADRARSKQAGFDHHLTKPAEPETIVKLLAQQRPR
jgi:CheY-like chemotaxis protein